MFCKKFQLKFLSWIDRHFSYLTLYIDFTLCITVRNLFTWFSFEMLYRLKTWWIFVYGVFRRSNCPFKLDSTVQCIFNFFSSFTLIYVYFIFLLFTFFILQSKSAVSIQTWRQSSTEAKVDCRRIQEIRPVVSGWGDRHGRYGNLLRGLGLRRTVSLSVSMSGGWAMTVMGEDENETNE